MSVAGITSAVVVEEVITAGPAAAQSCYNHDFTIYGGNYGSHYNVHIRCHSGSNHIWADYYYYGVHRPQDAGLNYWVPWYIHPTAIFQGNGAGNPGVMLLCANGGWGNGCWSDWNLQNLPNPAPQGWEIWRVDYSGWTPTWFYTVEGQSDSYGQVGTWNPSGPESASSFW